MSEYARGLEGVIANESSLSNVVGKIGELSYVGYHIDDLVENCCYEEIVFLLHHNRLPNATELAAFEKGLRSDRNLPDQVIDVSVSVDYLRLAKTWGGWAAAAVAGGLLAKFGEHFLALFG